MPPKRKVAAAKSANENDAAVESDQPLPPKTKKKQPTAAQKKQKLEKQVEGKVQNRGKKEQKKEEDVLGEGSLETKDDPAKKRLRSKKPEAEPPAKKELQNKTETNYDNINFSCTKKNNLDQIYNYKIASWNVDGIRAWVKKGGADYMNRENPDVLCLQETKCEKDKLPDEIKSVEGYESYWVSSNKEGYAGVGLLSKIKPINVKYGINNDEHDSEGRCITAEYEKFFVVCVYVPNAGRKLITLDKRLDWNELFKKYIQELDKKKPVIICGDMNVAHEEIDLARPKTNTKNAGFTREERDGMTDFLKAGFEDTFRKLYPNEKDAYTFWSYMMNARSKNIGWRLDYFIVSKRFADNVCDNVIRNQIYGSDHCPIVLFLHI